MTLDNIVGSSGEGRAERNIVMIHMLKTLMDFEIIGPSTR